MDAGFGIQASPVLIGDRVRIRGWALALVILAVPTDRLIAQAGGGWDWVIVPYAWLSNLDGHSIVGDAEVDVRDSTLQLSGAVRLEGRGNRLGFRMVASTATIANPTTIVLQADPNQPLVGAYHFSWTTVEMHGTLQVGPSDPASAFSVYAGMRYVRQAQRLTGDLSPPIARSQVWLEPVAGSQYFVAVGPRFWVSISGDIGGFAVGSDFTWTLGAELGFRLAPAMDLVMRYGYREVQYDNKELGQESYRWDAGVQQGWFLGAAFKLP